MDENMGVAVVFDDDDEGGGLGALGQEYGMVNEEVNEETDEEEDEGGVEAYGSGMLKGDEAADEGQNYDPNAVSVHTIDAHWLQRQLSKYYTDANTSARLAEETLAILQTTDERTCENKLVVLLDFDKFDFIKILLKNRAVVYYCTRLKQAQSESEKKAIETEMTG